MLSLCGSFERGAPQFPIANSRRKKATTLRVCPWGMVSQWALLRHQWKPSGFGSLGDNICVRNSSKYNKAANHIQNMFAKMCHSYFSTSFICVLRLLIQQIDPARTTFFLLCTPSPTDPSLLSAETYVVPLKREPRSP